MNASNRTVFKNKVKGYGIFFRRIHFDFFPALYRTGCKKTKKVNEMTGFPNDSSSSLFGFMRPMIRWNHSCIHRHHKGTWSARSFDQSLGFHKRGKTAIKNHENQVLISVLFFICHSDPIKFFLFQDKRFFHKNVFSRIQGIDYVTGMAIMARGNYNCIRLFVCNREISVVAWTKPCSGQPSLSEAGFGSHAFTKLTSLLKRRDEDLVGVISAPTKWIDIFS